MTIPSPEALYCALRQYEAVVDRQGVARLPELDRWYRLELPPLIAGRGSPHVTHSELVRVTEWKMARGVWRQPNLLLVRSNDPADVEQTSVAALARVPDPTAPIAELVKLKGVGPATASAVVSAAVPDLYPFFDELVATQLPGLGPVAWTLKYYVEYADALRQAAAALGGAWSPVMLERALWAHVGGTAGVRG